MRRAMPVANPRLRAAIPPGLPVGDLFHADAATLLAVLPAIRLADCRTNPAVAMTLAQVLGNGHEASSLRGIAVVSLGNLGGPIAADPSTMIRLASDVVRGAHQPLELRLAAVEALGLALQDWQDAGGWDLLVSVSLAKSEPESLRRLANQALQKRPK